MFKEIVYILILWFFLCASIIFGIQIYASTNQKQWGALYDYYVALVLDEIGLNDKGVSTSYLSGDRVVLSARSIVNSSFYRSTARELEQGLKEAAIVSSFISLVISILVVIYFIRKGVKKSADEYKRGAKVQDFNKIKWEIESYNRRHKYDAYSVAGMLYPARSETQHTSIFGTTGTGKTVLISDIVDQIRARGDRAIIFDTKCCYLEWFYNEERDHILNPFDKRSEKWNLLKEIRNISHIKSIAQAFIPEGKGNSSIWNEAGRIAFSSVLEKLHKDESITNRGIADLIMKQDIKDVVKFLKGTYAQSIIDTKAPETTGGVMFTMSAYLNNLRLMNDKKSESFSIKDWCKNASDSFVFITSNKEASAELVPLQTVWWEIVFSGLLSEQRNSSRKTWIILDEVGSLQKIPSLQEAMSRTREYGCCFVLGMQDIGQLEEIYGVKHARTISTLCNTRCLFRTPDPYTSSWLSKNIGEQELEQVKEGLSYGAHQMRDGVNINRQNIVRPLVMPSEIQNLRDLELYLQLPNYPFVKTEIKWKDRAIKSSGFIEMDSLISDSNNNSQKETKKLEENKLVTEIVVPNQTKTTESNKQSDEQREDFKESKYNF
jgi:type IV conjugative transfer system coupling protein TraD